MKSKVSSLVNLNTNPCKMCMPMGAATALYGIRDCMTILHGSQGCATYIRRHMATHYNEPVDIASSSLTEQGTVYGGEKNLKQGLNNLITLYHPKVIGIMTTCLAETIGEDIEGIKDRFYEENPQYKDITIIPVHSPGYGGTQYEGYMAAINAVVGKLEMDQEKNDKVNVIIPPHSPADIRYLKAVFRLFDIDCIFLPDISDNLDGGHHSEYSRLPGGGTDIGELKKMGGARFTIEFADIESAVSPAVTLFEQYQVPYKRILSPVGLNATDEFYSLLCELTNKVMPEVIEADRSRYLDGMIDSHKYNSAGRAVIYGEPEFVISTVRLCAENGIMPVVAATGSVCPKLNQYIEKVIEDMGNRYFVDEYMISDDTDFKQIEEYAIKYKANIMIGNSDGRRIEEELHIPLVRRSFPVHDRIGGQRLRMLGYEGSLSFLDEITNALLTVTENTYRETLFDTYYKGTPIDSEKKNDEIPADMLKKTMEHPCYNCGAHKFARIHLPVAPSCNVQCNYCVRKFDCPNESRPGVTSTILTPYEALARYKAVKEKMPNLTVVGIAGPGDSLAGNYQEVKKTLELIREFDPDVTFCLSTNGLMLPFYAEELVKLGVSHVTVTMSAVSPSVSGKIYKYIDYMGKRYEGEAAGAIMVSNQLSGLRILLAHGIICKVNIVTLKGINEEHIPLVVQTCKDLGCYITNIMQLIPVKGSAFEHLPMVSNKEILNLRNNCNKIMRQMFHCKQCRADAVGTLDQDLSVDLGIFSGKDKMKEETNQEKKKLRFAIASKSGVYVDMHFGHADEFYIYQYENGTLRFIENRNVKKYCAGIEECGEKEQNIKQLMTALHDCDGVIAMRIGETPKVLLKENQIRTFTIFDKIESAIYAAAGEM
jgi:nitrogenase molybdenum-iron protein alpha/beta subunit/MoaA/NifB/PqqE/SkfB family radical SAM enzyme